MARIIVLILAVIALGAVTVVFLQTLDPKILPIALPGVMMLALALRKRDE